VYQLTGLLWPCPIESGRKFQVVDHWGPNHKETASGQFAIFHTGRSQGVHPRDLLPFDGKMYTSFSAEGAADSYILRISAIDSAILKV
jgi:hypothetical protein